ncbi:C4-dicarboxylate transporter DctA [Kibdelosporangium philippinense]|uniref:C4-dicarboxylate transporter DctA n=1 Tax=Kibdelosporangium philippinense TaxID=211113 RepID=A0ABS8Z3D6_9PSEU|nr:C4-dicarboxylate transporter DctA [Kibdelosporangium philippinense]MCE7001528.1 C4-dicarboxylate transporter DctA [Kibdelosporangium philippinense]
MRGLHRSMFFQVLVAVVIGLAIGAIWPGFGADLKPLGDGFIKLIKMIIAPLIFCVVVTGIAKVGDLKAVGRIGLKAIIYFEVVTTAALALGLLVANIVGPGTGMNIDPSTLDPNAIDQKTGGAHLPGTVEFLLNIIPSSVVNAFATNSLLQVLLFSVLFGVALAAFADHSGPSLVLKMLDELTQIIFRIVGYVMKLAPLGALGAMAFIVGQYGLSSLSAFGLLIAACYGAAVLFCLVLVVIAKVGAGVNLWKFIQFTREEFALALATASSESVMPRMMAKLEQAGCQKAAVGLVLPTGYSFNLDGASIYLSLATVFLAQAVGVPLSLGDQIVIVLVLMLTSKGMAGVPGSAFLALSATLAAVGSIPAAAVSLLLGADRIMDSMRVFTNLLGNCVATFVVARWEGLLDRDQLDAALGKEAVKTA